MSYYDKAFKTTKEIKNPGHDKRRKYGEGAIASVPAGTVVFVFDRKPGRAVQVV